MTQLGKEVREHFWLESDEVWLHGPRTWPLSMGRPHLGQHHGRQQDESETGPVLNHLVLVQTEFYATIQVASIFSLLLLFVFSSWIKGLDNVQWPSNGFHLTATYKVRFSRAQKIFRSNEEETLRSHVGNPRQVGLGKIFRWNKDGREKGRENNNPEKKL